MARYGDTEAGYVLVASMVVLLALTLFGIWALSTSTYELTIAGNTQQVEKVFNISEGGSTREAVGVGFATETFYQISDPTLLNKMLLPTTDAAFDPGGDTSATSGSVASSNPDTWPMQNMLRNAANNEFDYRYLVTYLYPDTPPKGYDAAMFSGYKFRMDGQGVEQGRGRMVVEQGGVKVGVRATM